MSLRAPVGVNWCWILGEIFRNEIPVDSTNCWNHSVESLSSKSFILIKPMEMFKTQFFNNSRWITWHVEWNVPRDWQRTQVKKHDSSPAAAENSNYFLPRGEVADPSASNYAHLGRNREGGVSSCPGCKLHSSLPLFKTRKRMCSKGGKVLKTSWGWVGVCVEFQVHLKCNCVQGQCNVFTVFHAENVAPNCL